MEKDMVFLKDAQSADVCDGVPRGCLLEDFPFQSVSYSLSCKSVNVSGEAGSILFRMSDVIVMPTPSALHGLGSRTCVTASYEHCPFFQKCTPEQTIPT